MNIEIVGIEKSYRHNTVLRDLNLSAQSGNCIGILGGNGCGKSTLLSVLAGVQQADKGTFLCDGENLFTNTKLKESVLGYVPQGNPLIEELSAWDNLRMWYDRKTLKKELSDGVLNMLGINSFLKTPVYKMSGGMKKRLSIGCAVVRKPKILLLDEPSAALDLICKEQIYNYFDLFTKDGGILLIATHDIQELELCNKCYILKNGSLISYEYDGNIHHLVGCL